MLNHETSERYCKVISETLLAYLERESLAVIAILCALYTIVIIIDL